MTLEEEVRETTELVRTVSDRMGRLRHAIATAPLGAGSTEELGSLHLAVLDIRSRQERIYRAVRGES